MEELKQSILDKAFIRRIDRIKAKELLEKAEREVEGWESEEDNWYNIKKEGGNNIWE